MFSAKYFSLLLLCILSGCAQVSKHNTVPMVLQTAWFEGREAHYITTDVSDRDMARDMQANYAPRLRDSIPLYPKPPQVKSVLERVYTFPNVEQARNVFPSVPDPVGYESDDHSYSPLWLMYMVEWLDKTQVRELKSEGEIFEAEAKGWVKITRTDVVANCPIVTLVGQEES